MVKKLLISFILCLGIIFGLPAIASALDMNAKACILIDANTGRIIYEENANTQLSPASTTKTLTALLVLESVDDLSATVTLPDDYLNVGESGIYLEPGETLVIEDLLYALMLQSANDSAQALAIAVAGDEETFVQMMNDKTTELGLENSSWENPHGLDGESHFTTAYDLAMIAKEANKIPYFYELVNTSSWTMPWPNNENDRIFYNHNKFLNNYAGGDGIKTGYTSQAGNCLVGSATRDGMQLIGVVLGCENMTHYEEMTKLMDYGFDNYQPASVADMEEDLGTIKVSRGHLDEVELTLAKDVVIALPEGVQFETEYILEVPNKLTAPLSTDEPVGVIKFYDEKGNIGEAPVYLKESVTEYTFGGVFSDIWSKFFGSFL